MVTVALAVAASSGVKRLRFSNDYRYFFGPDNPQLVAFDALQDTYAKNDNVIFALAPKDGHVFTRSTLAAVEELTRASWQVPYSLRVDSVTNFQHTLAEGDDLAVRDLVSGAQDLTDSELLSIKEIALTEPLLRNRLISPLAHVTGVNVTVNLPGKSMGEVPEVVAFVREMAEDFSVRHPDIEVYLSGVTMMNNAFAEASRHDMSTLVPVMFLVIVVVMALLLRSFFGTLVTVIVIVMSALSGLGLAGWLGIPLTPPSSAAPTIILTLAVADSVHILVSIFHEMMAGRSRHEAIVESLRVNLQPVFLTSLTTIVGFLSMNFSDAPPFRDLGNIVAMGVGFAFLYSIFFLPAFISLLPLRVREVGGGKMHLMERFADLVVRGRALIFWTMLAIIVLITSGVSRIELNDMFVEYFDERYEFRTDTDFVTKNLTGIYFIEYSLEAGGEGAVSDPAYLRKVEEFALWYRAQPGVLHVNTITDTMKRLNRNMHGGDPSYYRVPEERALAAQYLLLYEFSLPYGLDLNNQINLDKSSTRFTITLESLTTKKLLALEERAQGWLRDNAPVEMFTIGASPSIMFSYIAKRNIRSMFFGTGFALVLISAILIVALRSMKMGLVSLVPNLVPAFMAFGLWGLLYSQVGLGLAVVAAMSLGIVVDDTVHFISKYLRARRELGLAAPDAVRYSFKTVGTALWVTSLVLMAGFMVLARSGFKLNSDMGLLTAIAIGFALLVDFLFLPPLLMRIDKR